MAPHHSRCAFNRELNISPASAVSRSLADRQKRKGAIMDGNSESTVFQSISE